MLSGRGRKTKLEKATLLFGTLRRYRLAAEDDNKELSANLYDLVQLYVKIYRINSQKAKEYRFVSGFAQVLSGILRAEYIEKCYANDFKAFTDDINRKLDEELEICFDVIDSCKKIGKARIKSKIH